MGRFGLESARQNLKLASRLPLNRHVTTIIELIMRYEPSLRNLPVEPEPNHNRLELVRTAKNPTINVELLNMTD